MGWRPSAVRFYRILLLAYPAAFRHEYGAELELFFAQRLRSEPALLVWLETLPDLAVSAASEHLSILIDDLQYSMRTLVKSPAFTLTALLTIALGIGATTTVFSLVNAMLTRSMPYREPQQLVNIWTPNSRFTKAPQLPPSNADFYDWQRLNHSFSSLTEWRWVDLGLVTGNATLSIRVAAVAGNFFETLGVEPEIGRTIDPRDDQPGLEHVAVISDGLWRMYFAADRTIAGRKLQLSRDWYTIVGVMPKRFLYPHMTDTGYRLGGPDHTDVWIPAALTAAQKAERVNRNQSVIARLRPRVGVKQAQVEMSQIEAGLAPHYPPAFRGWTALVRPFIDTAIGPVRSMMSLLAGAVALVLLIACANVASLLMARAAARSGELGVRTALGAGRARVIRLMLTEALLIAIAGGAMGTALSVAGVAAMARLNPGDIPGIEDASPDVRVMLFAVLLSAGCGVLFGCVPGLASWRVDVASFLRQTHASIGARPGRLRRSLTVGEVALSVVLLTGAGLLIKSYVRLESVDKGLDESAVVMSVSLDRAVYPRPEQQAAFVRRLLAEVAGLPGIESAGAVDFLPMNRNYQHLALDVKTHPQAPRQPVDTRSATPGYFHSAETPLLRGRLFDDSDDGTHAPVAIVNRTFAQAWFAGQDAIGDAIGQQIRLGGDDSPWSTIVGVVADTRHAQLEEEPRPAVYQPFWQAPRLQTDLTVRTQLPLVEAAAMMRGALWRVDPTVPAIGIRTIGGMISEGNARRRFETAILGGFAGLSVFLALVGLYGLTLYTVRQRTAEIGIRMALGGTPARVVRMVIEQNMILVAVGLALGLAAASWMTRILRASLYGVTPLDPETFAAVTAFMLLAALAACLIPAWRAAKIDPMAALRWE